MSLSQDQQRILNMLINTSVNDMRSSLQCAEQHGGTDPVVLQVALTTVEMRGDKTKAKVLQSQIRRQQKARAA